MAEKHFEEASAAVSSLPEQAPPELKDVLTRICSVLTETLVEHPEERMVLGGTPNLTRNVADFPNSLREIGQKVSIERVTVHLGR